MPAISPAKNCSPQTFYGFSQLLAFALLIYTPAESIRASLKEEVITEAEERLEYKAREEPERVLEKKEIFSRFVLTLVFLCRSNNQNMAFLGKTQRCTACDKPVYLVDKLAADKRIYHKACFRCYHCHGTLKLSSFNSFEGVLYCRPHYDQLLKQTGSLDKSFEGTPKALKPEKPVDSENRNKVSSLFAGTREKCVSCSKTVYPLEKVAVNGSAYHRSCFKCTRGGCRISPSNFIAFEGKLYCKHHNIQLFKEKGNYSQLETNVQKEPLSVPVTAQLELAAES